MIFSLILYLLYLLFSVSLILIYFRVADHFNIVDKPNHRSSHQHLTILGAGIIFPLVITLHSMINGVIYPYFTAGLILISIISFWDDLQPLSFIIRLLGHLTSVSLIFFETGLIDYSPWLVLTLYVIVIGSLNAYNFMDGINGMTGAYSLVTIVSLYYINEYVTVFVSSDWLIICAISLIAFSIFNFRPLAKCFAGDVGSVSMAFIIIFFILTLTIKTADFKYISLLLIYGLDSVTTIVFRLIRRENIFLAHRGHFYQYLANSKSWPHLAVSLLYAVLQILINVLIISHSFSFLCFIIFLVISGLAVAGIRLMSEGKTYLLTSRREIT